MVYESEFCLSRMNVFINTEDYQHRRECIHQQLSGKSWEADSSIGQKSSCEEYAPHTAKYILGGVFFTISVIFSANSRRRIYSSVHHFAILHKDTHGLFSLDLMSSVRHYEYGVAIDNQCKSAFSTPELFSSAHVWLLGC